MNQVRYLHKDHLGSIDTLTDETGQIVERLSYDAFGKRRQPNGQDAANLGAATTHHGYTGHEHLDGLGLIHMNGRLYDPTLARFTQADPYIQNPTNPQDLNRYSYVNNNPLKYTDPSGYKKAWQNITLNNTKDVFEGAWNGVKNFVNENWTQIRGGIKVVAGLPLPCFARIVAAAWGSPLRSVPKTI